jgi:hypothetical protein
MLGGDVNSVVTSLHATSASLGASGPGVPGVLAIDGARVGVAILLNAESVTRFTTMSDVSDDGTSAGFDAAAAKLRASRPSRKTRQDAINRTLVGSA